ncbi:amidohydrolase family protein [Nocardioides fonticola]|uniref:Amidohydrolase family protein n=1 Tax=Nocardioides fonticola TaxID=450363 RepID=A0ABP7XIM8_9ACTN
MTEPAWADDAADVRAFAARLGLRGIFDAHTHFLPERLQAKVWAQFDAAGPLIGRPWPIRYRQSTEERVEFLRACGVLRFPSLPYAHRPGIAEGLNEWSARFADGVPEAIRSATLYPEPDVVAYLAAAIDDGVEVVKVHVQVGAFDLLDPLLDDAWGLLTEARVPVLIHAGHAPVGTDLTGPEPMARLMAAHPRLTVIAAHLGAPDYLDFCDLADRYERFHLDTTMVFTDFWETTYPASLTARLRDLAPKVLFGSDFPTIPYPYVHQLEALERLELGEEWLRAVCLDNGERLFRGR